MSGGRNDRQRHVRQHLPGPGAEVHRRLLERDVHRRQARLHDHRHIGHGEGDVRDGDGGEAAAARPADPFRHEDEQHELEMPVITSGMTSGAVTRPDKPARPRNCWKRASAMPAMVPRMVAKVALVTAICSDRTAALSTWSLLQQLAVPLGGEAAPHGGQPRLVEGEDDERQDRDVEEGKAEAQAGDEEDGAAVHVRPSARSCARPLEVAVDHHRQHQHQQQRHGDGRGHRPVARGREFIADHAADHRVRRIADEAGDDEFARCRDEDEQRARDDAGNAQRQRHVLEHLPGPASPGRSPPRSACGRASRDWRRAAGS